MEFKVNDLKIAKSKKAFKAAVKADPSKVFLTNVSTMFEPPFIGPASEIPNVKRHTVVGPDPHTKRNWFATIQTINGRTIVE